MIVSATSLTGFVCHTVFCVAPNNAHTTGGKLPVLWRVRRGSPTTSRASRGRAQSKRKLSNHQSTNSYSSSVLRLNLMWNMVFTCEFSHSFHFTRYTLSSSSVQITEEGSAFFSPFCFVSTYQ